MSLLNRLFGTDTDEDDDCDHDWSEWEECPAGEWGSLIWNWQDGENKPFIFLTVHDERTCRDCGETETRNKCQRRQYLEISHTEEIDLEDSEGGEVDG